MPLDTSADQRLVIIRKPPTILWIAALFALPFIAVALFVPRFRLIGLLFVIFALVRFARQTLSVRVTDKDVVLQTAITRKRYSLRAIKHVELADTPAALGARTPSVRLEFFNGRSVEISGFPSNETNTLYKAILAAGQRVESTEQS